VTDPGTGTPLTRRAARAAAERAHTSELTQPPTPATRRARRPQQIPADDVTDPLTDAVVEVRHAAHRRARRTRGVFTLIAAGVLLIGGTAAVSAAAYGTSTAADPRAAATASASASATPTVTPPPVDPATVTTTRNPCTDAAFTAALAAHDTEAAVSAAGGGAAFREEVVTGEAPCVRLDDPSFTWVVVNKQRPYSPKDYTPSPVVAPGGVQVINGGSLRSDAAAGLSDMVAAAKQAGAGAIALDSGYRSYRTQVTSYGVQVTSRGSSGADLVSARPGFSEHQSGLAGDVVACARSCGTLDMLAGTPQDQFILAHAWEYGWVVRYEAGRTPVTGYASEPWHLRFIGVQLAKAYHDGGFHTLEEFFGLPAAPSY